MTASKQKKLLLIINPVSGTRRIFKYADYITEKLTDSGFEVTVHYTDNLSRTAYHIVLTYGRDFDVIVCSGGDGTIKDTVSGVIDLGAVIPVGIIPMGSTNDFAKSVGVPTEDVDKAVKAITDGKLTTVDMGVCGNELFIDMARFGNFTSLSYTTDQKMKNRLGVKAYYLKALQELFRIKSYGARIEADGRVFEGKYFFGAISNSYYSLGNKGFLGKEDVKLDDGLHELILVRMFTSPMDVIRLIKDIMSDNIKNNPLITIVHCKRVRLDFRKPTSITVDGEFAGIHTGIEAGNIRHGINIITGD